MCIYFNVDEPPLENEDDLDFGMYNPPNVVNNPNINVDLQKGRRLQARIINNYFR